MIDLQRLPDVLADCCLDAGLDPSSFVVFVVEATRPPGATPLAYLHPGAEVRPDTVRVFRFVTAERARRHGGDHRLAVWRELPGVPRPALGPMLRHEVEHARRFERSGPAFFEADELLRRHVDREGGHAYALLPSEREANAASSVYAARRLSASECEAVLGCSDCVNLLGASPPPADVVAATLTLLAELVALAPAATGGSLPAVDTLAAACRDWQARPRVEGRGERGAPRVELVAPLDGLAVVCRPP